jgi:hypothetical protein
MEESEYRDPITTCVMVSKSMMGAYGPFHSEQAAWDFASKRGFLPTAWCPIPLLPAKVPTHALEGHVL